MKNADDTYLIIAASLVASLYQSAGNTGTEY